MGFVHPNTRTVCTFFQKWTLNGTKATAFAQDMATAGTIVVGVITLFTGSFTGVSIVLVSCGASGGGVGVVSGVTFGTTEVVVSGGVSATTVFDGVVRGAVLTSLRNMNQ